MDSVGKELVTAASIVMMAEITYYGPGMIRGLLHSRYLETPYEFLSFVRMIDKMEEIFDEKKFPSAYLTPRTFSGAKRRVKRTEAGGSGIMKQAIQTASDEGARSSKCTFEITVRFRQNATWQGHILWTEKNQRQNFRSVLEMLKLMDEALTEGEVENKPVSWENEPQA